MKRKEWVSIGLVSALAVAAVVYVLILREEEGEEKPPKGAPQLHLENPGSQDDFPKPPMESEIG